MRTRITTKRVAVTALLAGVLALVLIVFFIREGPHAPEALPAVDIADLTPGDDGLRRSGDDALFSGVMETRYPDGTLRSRSTVVDGRLHGVSEGWYPDGTPEVREFFEAGISHGTRTRWHPHGTKASETTIVQGELNGPFRRWHDNGQLAQEIFMQNGQAHGVSKAFFPSGYLQARAELDKGSVLRQEFWEDRRMRDPDL